MSENLTATEISPSSQRMARPKNEFEKVLLRLKPGTNARLDEVRGDRDRATFVRQAIDTAIEAELKRRERTRPSQTS